jgi:hypothetical protein
MNEQCLLFSGCSVKSKPLALLPRLDNSMIIINLNPTSTINVKSTRNLTWYLFSLSRRTHVHIYKTHEKTRMQVYKFVMVRLKKVDARETHIILRHFAQNASLTWQNELDWACKYIRKHRMGGWGYNKWVAEGVRHYCGITKHEESWESFIYLDFID